MADAQARPAAADASSGPKLGYSVREAAKLTPFGYERLLKFIQSGELVARRAEGGGKFVILHDDLDRFLTNLPVV